MGAFAVIGACFNNIAMAITFQREDGVLKRAHGTPLPVSSFLGARILHAMFISVILVALTLGFGHAVYQATIPTGTSLLRFIVVVLVGSAAFCALGLALSGAIPNTDATAPVVNAVALPVEFLSGIFIAFGNTTPSWSGSPGCSRSATRPRHAGRHPQHAVQLDLRACRGRLGRRRHARRHSLLPLGTPPGLGARQVRALVPGYRGVRSWAGGP
jgi:hypothetical protein